MKPSLGRVVHYQLTEMDADQINKRRSDFLAFQAARHPASPGQTGASGHVAHVGNSVAAGDCAPAVVVAIWDPDSEYPSVNLQVLLDGADAFWATSVLEGDEPGTWCWPPRV